jgi:hypothetical protein
MEKKFLVRIGKRERLMTRAAYVSYLRAMADRDVKDPMLDDYHVAMTRRRADRIEQRKANPPELN